MIHTIFSFKQDSMKIAPIHSTLSENGVFIFNDHTKEKFTPIAMIALI